MANVPLPGYSFEVLIKGQTLSFQEITGLKSTIEYKTVNRGGDTRREYKVPKKIKYENVTFKKGLFSQSLVQDLMGAFKIDKNFDCVNVDFGNILIYLKDDLNSCHHFTWELQNVYPISWEIGGFNAMKSQFMMETLVFGYSELNFR